jgi:hypothetical protein
VNNNSERKNEAIVRWIEVIFNPFLHPSPPFNRLFVFVASIFFLAAFHEGDDLIAPSSRESSNNERGDEVPARGITVISYLCRVSFIKTLYFIAVVLAKENRVRRQVRNELFKIL